jgi:hypothetical protein
MQIIRLLQWELSWIVSDRSSFWLSWTGTPEEWKGKGGGELFNNGHFLYM